MKQFCLIRFRAAFFLALLTLLVHPQPGKAPVPLRYLAIGNSITRHPVCAYWWNDCGMAASEAQNDFVHLVAGWLYAQNDGISLSIANLVEWETADDKEKEGTYALLTPYLAENPDVITLQLSENASFDKHFGKSYARLVRFLRAQCPDAVIVLVDDFWSDEKSAAKRKAAKELDLPFADLSGIRGDPRYQQEVGGAVYDANGEPFVIDRSDVARHPNDAGMAAIAEAVIAQLSQLSLQ